MDPLVGTDGGRALEWQGKVGFVGGVTPTIDRHHAVMGAMGERFHALPAIRSRRRPTSPPRPLARRQGEEDAPRDRRLSRCAHRQPEHRQPRQRRGKNNAASCARDASLSEHAQPSNATTSSREIELVPGSEAPTRLIVALSLMLAV